MAPFRNPKYAKVEYGGYGRRPSLEGSYSRIQAMQAIEVVNRLDEFIVRFYGHFRLLKGDWSLFKRSQCLGEGCDIIDLWD